MHPETVWMGNRARLKMLSYPGTMILHLVETAHLKCGQHYCLLVLRKHSPFRYYLESDSF